MNLAEILQQRYSKVNITKITNWIGVDSQRFDQLVQLFLQDDYVTAQQASWVLSHCIEAYPSLIEPYYEVFISKIEDDNLSDTAKRNIIRMWQFADIPDTFQGAIYDICFRYLSSTEAVAIIAFSITVCYNISLKIPELKTELRLTLEDLLLKHQEGGSPAIKSRAKNILAKMKKK